MSFEMLSDFLSLSELLTVPAILSLLTVSFMGVVLGIDNVVFIAVIAKRAPQGQEERARTLGIIMAMVARITLIFSIGILLRFENVQLVTLPFMPDHHQDITVKGAILVVGGVFLIYKATQEIFEKLEGDDHHADGQAKRLPLAQILFTLLLLNLVFSIDSVLTAVGIAYNQLVPIMVGGVLISTFIMLVAAGPLTRFMERHPTTEMLAFAFMLLIGAILLGEGLHYEVPKALIYGIMGFSIFVEMLNIISRRRTGQPVHLHKHAPIKLPD